MCNQIKEFINHFKRLTSVSDDLEKELTTRSIPIAVNKGAFLHKADSICKKTFWIQNGLLRTYYLKDGKEITDVFASEGQWITSVQSFIKNESDQNYLQAIENSVVYALSKDDLMFLFENFHEMERFGRISMSTNYIRWLKNWNHTNLLRPKISMCISARFTILFYIDYP